MINQTDELIITIVVLSGSITFGIILAVILFYYMLYVINRIIKAVQNTIYYLLNGK